MNNTKINAVIVGDSICPRGHRITSLVVTMPRIILAEFNTHRMFSRNTSSSRAIPFKRMLKTIEEDPFIPIAFQKEHSGMQGTKYMNEREIEVAISAWLVARNKAIEQATYLNKKEVTKQICNRLLEPFMWTTVLVTATEWNNFFSLRCPQYEVNGNLYKSKKAALDIEEDINHLPKLDNTLGWLQLNKGMAEIHMMEVAECIYDAINESKPKELKIGEWHIPFEDKIDKMALAIPHNTTTYDPIVINDVIKVSTSMAARTSYTVVGNEKEFTYQNHIDLHDRLINQVPLHASPMEHCAKVITDEEYRNSYKGNIKPIHIEFDFTYIEEIAEINLNNCGWFDNFHGFQSYRNVLENETSI